ncbi:MAG: glucose 1-dehydrogenase [Alicyclobacillus macrosporangiidus]|uniref:SDR family NAD(P)-dependent oxidoreductase n=1 Tax=Alicyclobacillus macrosporangiidus TaxID=392015 RepID=UPI0026EAE812|nr:glucose 1-dehydrogenase [Alicyclobacillus macrosporangiidus]MCL6597521.1 glucose 1-dehydrogenase [Alicyclobacillus macrosporangiidus]
MGHEGRVAVVTGAARGIGRAIAEAFASAGGRVVMADRDVEPLERAAADLRQAGADVTAVAADVAKPEDVVRLMEAAVDAYGRIDTLINNAGVSRWKSPLELTVDEWDEVLNINLRGVFLCAREAARRMREQGGGAIVNIASTRALMSGPDSEAYAASKGGVVALTHALAVSLGPYGIRVNAISPGWIETGDYGALRPIDHAQHPSGRVGRPQDIARACLFLADPDNGFITGENLVIDGGMTKKMIYEP